MEARDSQRSSPRVSPPRALARLRVDNQAFGSDAGHAIACGFYQTAQQFTTASQAVAISPDGTQMVYVANQRLFLRSLSELDARPIQGSDSPGITLNAVSSPVFSPDGRSIAYWDQGAIKRIAIGGGTAVSLCQSDTAVGHELERGRNRVRCRVPRGIMRVSANGGMPEQIASVESTELAASPQMLPGNRAVLFTTLRQGLPAGALNNGTRRASSCKRWDRANERLVVERGSHARYLPSGQIRGHRGRVNRPRRRSTSGGSRELVVPCRSCPACMVRSIRKHVRAVQRVGPRFARVRLRTGFDVGCSA